MKTSDFSNDQKSNYPLGCDLVGGWRRGGRVEDSDGGGPPGRGIASERKSIGISSA